MGFIKILDKNSKIGKLERLIICDYKHITKPKKKKYKNLMDMHIHINSVFVSKADRLHLVLPVLIEEEDLYKHLNILFKEYDTLFNYVDKHKENYYLTRYDLNILNTKCSTQPELLNYLISKLNKYPDIDLPLEQ